MNRKLLLVSLFLTGALLSPLTFGQQPDTTQLLLNLLVRKGVITQQEAADLQVQVQAAANSPPPPATVSAAAPAAPAEAVVTNRGSKSPLSFRIGVADFTPLGFLDFTAVYRNVLNGGDIGTSFGSFPYSNTAAAKLSETRFSAKNSRIGLRVDSTVGDTKVLGYLETDFLGNQPTNINVASNSDTLRMRVYFVDLTHGQWEFLAGQDWSMLTPNRKGISPIPSDIFFTQDVDTNYQVGLVWGRTPQIRAVYHVTDAWTIGLSAENPDQYVGGGVTLPSNFTATQVDQGSNGTATPNVIPDLIGKIAFDAKFGDLPFHADAAALYRYFKVNTFVPANGIDSNATANGYGGSVNMSIGVLPNLLLIENAFASKGGGRYISTGLAPDFIVNPPDSTGVDSLSTVYSYAGMLGFEWDATKATKIYGYYGLAHIGKKIGVTSTGSLVGYGFPTSSTTNNKTIDEYTIGWAQTLWKNPSYGDLKFLAQLSYLDRKPWYIAPGSPSDAHISMLYMDIRYDLP